MLSSPYSYQLEMYTIEGIALGRAVLKVDWEPAREWTRFAAVRAGRLPATAVDVATAVDPIWHPRAGEPYIEGFSVAMTFGREVVEHAFGIEYFARLAQRALEALAERNGLEGLDTARYITTAYPAPDAAPAASAPAFVAREIAPDLTLHDGSLDEIAARATLAGDLTSDNVPVFLPQRVLEEAAGLTGIARQKETGGILIGHLRRDPQRRELFTEVTAQIPARHTEADLTTLTFTSDTWTDVRSAIALRGRGELMLGWWHSHPVQEWCRGCEPASQHACSAGAGFLSADDRALHRTVFPRAYSLALVVSDVGPDGPTFSLFGWRDGVIARRGFAILDQTPGARGTSSSALSSPEHAARETPCRAHAR